MSDQKTCKKCKRKFDNMTLFQCDPSHKCVEPHHTMTQLESCEFLYKLGAMTKSHYTWAKEYIANLSEEDEIKYQQRKAEHRAYIINCLEEQRIKDEHRQNKAAYEYQMRQMNRLKR